MKKIYFSRRMIWALLAFGILARLAHYLSGRSLWLDEAALAINIIGRNYGELFQLLDFNQAAPVGFLVVVKFLVNLFGSGEAVLRLLPFLAGVAALLLFYPLARRALSPGAVPLAVALFVFSDRAIYYSGEIKQYSTDLFFAVLILFFAYHLYDRGFRVRVMVVFGLLGGLAVWFSHPSVFVLAGAGAVLLLTALREKKNDPRIITGLVAAGVFWVVNFAVNYLFISGPTSRIQLFEEFFALNYPPFPPLSAADMAWYPHTFVSIMCNPVGFSVPHAALVVVALVAGALFLRQRDKVLTLGLVFIPLAVLLAASLAGFYPIADRLLLFTLPMFYLLIGEGIYHVAAGLSRKHIIVGAVFLAALYFMMMGRGFYHLAFPRYVYEAKPAIGYLLDNREENDLVYINYMAVTMFEYYTRERQIPYMVGPGDISDPGAIEDALANLPQEERIWILFLHDLLGEEEAVLTYLQDRSIVIDSFTDLGASLYLVRLHQQR